MSTEIAKKLLSQFYKDGQLVYDHISDPIYNRLGYTQAVGMLITVSSLLALLIPIESNRPVYNAYAALDKLASNQYGSHAVGLNILNYVVWAISSVMLGSFIGRQIGSGIWALYCKIGTKCQSHHTMDLILSENNKNKVIKNLIFTVFESGRESYGELLIPEQKKELTRWIQDVNIFFTKKRQRDLKRGKVQSAEEWWIVKKKFYQDFKPQTLLDKLEDYNDKLQANITKVQSNYNILINRIIPSAQQNKQNYLVDKMNYIKLLLNIINDFDTSVGMRHQRRSSQSIYQNKKSLNSLFDDVEKNQQSQTELLTSMQQASKVMQKVLSRLQLNIAEIPTTPDWLSNLLSYDLNHRYQIQCKRELSSYIKKIISCQKHLPPGERQQFIEGIKQITNNEVNDIHAAEWVIDIRQSEASTDSDQYSTARSIINTPLII